jgi:ubiquinone/menaquinone biosynthesis C-methylase UbiE
MERSLRQKLRAWLLDRLYHECAFLYDSVATLISRGHWFRWGAALLPFMHAPIVELGCGTGHLQALFAQQQRMSIGVDRSRAMLARTHAPGTVVQADSRQLPLADACMRTVVAVFPANYILDPATHAEIERVLCAQGTVVILLAAGQLALTQHPLWQALDARGWHLTAPELIEAGTPLQVIIGVPHARPC